jgi:N utilization substance protein B
MLYQVDQTGVSAEELFAQFWQGQAAAGPELREFAERLVRGVVERQEEIDARISVAADRWRLERMAIVDRNVLRLAVYELLFESVTPAAVVIDEAVEVSKKFGGEDSSAFVNGMLDAVRRSLGLPDPGTPSS